MFVVDIPFMLPSVKRVRRRRRRVIRQAHRQMWKLVQAEASLAQRREQTQQCLSSDLMKLTCFSPARRDMRLIDIGESSTTSTSWTWAARVWRSPLDNFGCSYVPILFTYSCAAWCHMLFFSRADTRQHLFLLDLRSDRWLGKISFSSSSQWYNIKLSE